MNFDDLDNILKNAKPKASNASTWDEVIGKYGGKKNTGYGKIDDSGVYLSDRYKDIIKVKDMRKPTNIPSVTEIKKADIGSDIKQPSYSRVDPKRYEKMSPFWKNVNNAFDKLSDNKVLNTFYKGVDAATGQEGQESAVAYNPNNTFEGGLGNFAFENLGRMSGAVLMGNSAGLNGVNTLNAFDDMAAGVVRKGLAKTGLQGNLAPILQKGLTGALEGSVSNAFEDTMAGRDAKQILDSTLQGGAFGGLMGGTIGGIDIARGKLKSVELPQIDSSDFRAETKYKLDNQANVSSTKSKYQGRYGIKNTALENSYKEYEEAVKAVQDYWGHWKLDEAEIRLGAEELGIDLDGIIKRMELAEKNGVNIRDLSEEARFKRTIGFNNNIPSLENKVFPKANNIITYPGIPNIPNADSFEAAMERSMLPERFRTPENLKPPDIPKKNVEAEFRGTDINAKSQPAINTVNDSFNLDLAKGTEFDGMTVRQLNSLKSKLDRDYNDLMFEHKFEMAEEVRVKLDSINDILGVESIIDKTGSWKKKSAAGLGRETLDRNAEDVMGDFAPSFIRDYSDPIKSGEANRIRFMNDLRDKVKNLGIKAGSMESELVQKFGEGEISINQLKAATGNWEKVVNASNFLRNTYDELLNMTNEVLERNGYSPISRRENYFPHMGELQSFMEKIGIEIDEIPTAITGLTENFVPGKSFFGNALRRTGDKTVYDAVRGFDNYIEGASKLIHHTDNIQRLRGFESELRSMAGNDQKLSTFVAYIHEYTNLLAGKKSAVDRIVETNFGRGSFKFMNYIRRKVGGNMVGANISSALTNFIPITQSLATTSKPASIKGLMETMASLVARNDDFITKSDFLTRRFGSDKLSSTNWEKFGEVLAKPFEVVDTFTSQFVVRSKYNELITKGLSPKEAMRRADDYAARLITDRSLGQLPNLLNSKTLGLFTQFQSEVNNQVSFILKDIPKIYKLEKNGNLKLGFAIGQVALYSWMANNVYEKITGRRPATDIIDMISSTIDDFSNEDMKKSDAIDNLVESMLNQLPFTSTFTGGRIPIMAPLEGLKEAGKGLIQTTFNEDGGTENLVDGLSKSIPFLFLPAGGNQLTKSIKGYSALKDGAIYNSPYNMDKSKLKYPVNKSLENAIKGLTLGTSAFDESKTYYDKGRRSLSAKQTEEYNSYLSKGLTPQEAYDVIIKAREERAKKRRK